METTKSPQHFFRILLKHYLKNRKADRARIYKGLGDVVRATRGAVIDPAEYLVLEEKKLIYLVNSKAACSSIKGAMLGVVRDISTITDSMAVHSIGVELGMSSSQLTPEEASDYFVFTFVRDPFYRLASLYANKFSSSDIRQHGFHFDKYLGGIINYSLTFEAFVKTIAKIPDQLSDRHFKQQAFLIYDESPKIDFIGKVENFNTDFSQLNAKFDLGAPPHLNQSKAQVIHKYYDRGLLNIVKNRYQRDIEAFDYGATFDELSRIV